MATSLSSSYKARIIDGQLGGGCSTSYPVPPPSALCHRRRCWHATNAPEKKNTACSASSSGRVADPVYMQEYQKLKDSTITVARQAGGGLALYLLLVVDGEAGLCALIGSAACNLYLLWLFYDVDSVNVDTKIPLWEAERIESSLGRGIAKVFAAYQHALRPRLLVLVALAGLTALWNQVSGAPLDTAHQGFLLLGFLAYKVPLVLKIADDNVSKSYKDDEMSRPLIDSFDDNLDQWGRPKKQIVPLPTEALPDNIDTSSVDLEKLSSLGGMMEMMGFQQQRKHTHGSAEEAQAAAADKK